MNYLKEAFIIEEISQYSSKARKTLLFFGKLYNEDVCFNSLRKTNEVFDIDHNLENIVYNELCYMGYNIDFFNYNGKEIDFRCKKIIKCI